MSIKFTANKILINSLLLTVYACFFSVQLVFGFNASLTRDTVTYKNIAPISSKKNATVVKENDKRSSKKVNIRLNKRFQPSCFPAIIYTDLVTPFYYLVPKSTFLNVTGFIPSCYAAARSLRGPPVVV